MSSPEQRHSLMQQARKPRSMLAGQEGLEPPTTGFGDRDSGQLSYCPLLSSYRRPPWTVQPVHGDRLATACPALPGRPRRPPCLPPVDMRRPGGGLPDGEVYVVKRRDVEPAVRTGLPDGFRGAFRS